MGNFGDLLKGNEPVLVDFYATWCGPCKAMTPIIKELAKDLSGKVKVLKVDIDKNGKVADKYGIRSVPTLILFRKGKILWRKSGGMDKKTLLNSVSSYL